MTDDEPTPAPSGQVAGQSRTTPFMVPPCRQCRRPVRGRRRNGFCSDRCRMRHRRIEGAGRRHELFGQIEEALHQLRREGRCE